MSDNTKAKKAASLLRSYGRNGDTEIVHMNREEVGALHGLASMAGRELTTNPDTGMPEAFNLFDILPFALNFIFPGMGTAAQIGIGALSGAAGAAVEGEDPLMAALTGGAMSGIGSAIFGGSSGVPGLDETAMNTLQAGPLGTGVSEAALRSTDEAVRAAAERAMAQVSSPAQSSILGNMDVNPKIQNWLDDPLSGSNMPWTLAGGAALASMMPAQGLGDDLENPQDGKAHLRNPAAPRPYQPLNTPDLNTYGQLGSDYQSEVNYFLNNPGPYTGSPYEGDPYAYPFKDGGMVHKGGGLACYADGGFVVPSGQDRINGANSAVQRMTGIQGFIPSSMASMQPVGGATLSPENPFLRLMRPDNPLRQAAQVMPQPMSGKGIVDKRGMTPGQIRRAEQGGKFSNPGNFTLPPRQIIPQQAPTPQASMMPVGQPTMSPALFSAPRFSDGGIAGMPGAVDQNILSQLMGGAREIPGEEMGMDDSIPAAIDGAQPAKLSSGEVVIPADVVSMLGDGNTRAGAAILRQMVERVRLQKTGSPDQSEQIDLEGSLPA